MIALLVCLPLVGSYIHWGALPPGFDLLADKRTVRPQTSWLVFVILTLVAIPIWSFVCKPQWFGFKGQAFAKSANSVNARVTKFLCSSVSFTLFIPNQLFNYICQTSITSF